MHSDAKESTKAVTAILVRPTEIDTATDSTITYGKVNAFSSETLIQDSIMAQSVVLSRARLLSE